MGIRRELEVYHGQTKLQSFVIKKSKVQLGNKITKSNQEANDITLEDDKVARRHAQITREGDILLLSNLHKDYSTSVNGKAIVRKQLKGRDEIIIGPYHLIYREVKEINWVPIIIAGVIIILIGAFFLMRETPEDKFNRAVSILDSRPIDAMPLFEELDNQFPGNPEVKYYLAKAYYKVGYLWQNKIYLRKAVDMYEKCSLMEGVADNPEFIARVEEGINEVKTYRIELKKQLELKDILEE